MTEFGAKLKRLLDQRGMTQKELAQKAGITEAAVSRYIHGTRVPKMPTAVHIAKALNVSLDEFTE